jgi:hypothetical protein
VPSNYAVFGTQSRGTGRHDVFTNYLQAANVYVTDNSVPAVDAGSPGMPAGWVDNATFSAHASQNGLGIASMSLSSDRTPGWTAATANTGCGADPSNHCRADETITPSSSALYDGVNQISASATDVLGRTASGVIGQVKVDHSPPTLGSYGGDLAPGVNRWVKGGLHQLTYTATDPYSGVSNAGPAITKPIAGGDSFGRSVTGGWGTAEAGGSWLAYYGNDSSFGVAGDDRSAGVVEQRQAAEWGVGPRCGCAGGCELPGVGAGGW